jgi:outer membrane protein
MNRFFSAARRLTVISLLAAAFCFVSVAHAQSGPRIGVVDFARLIDQAPQSQAIMQALQDEFSSREREIMAQQRALRERMETLERDAQVMGATEREALNRQIRDEQRNLQRAEEVFLEDLNYRRNEETNRLQRTLLEEIQRFATSQGYDVILVDVLYFSDSVDVTADVLQALQARQQGSR